MSSESLWRATCPGRGARVIQAVTRDEAAEWYARNVLYRNRDVQAVKHEGRGWYEVTRLIEGIPVDLPHHFRVARPPSKEDRGVDERRGVEAVAQALLPVYGPGWAVTELGISDEEHGEGRADLAYFTDSGLSVGAEIKTQKDSVARLERQVARYDGLFDACILACTPNHVGHAVPVLPAHWGVAVLDPEEHGLDSVLRPAETVRQGGFPLAMLMEELWGDELRRELRSRRIPFWNRSSRRTMAALLREKVGDAECWRLSLHTLGKLRREGKRVQAWRVEP